MKKLGLSQTQDTSTLSNEAHLEPKDLDALSGAHDDKRIAEWAKKEYQKCKNDGSAIRNQWYVNLAFFKGDQYVQLINGRLINTPPIPSRVRMKINRIRPAVRTEISRMTSQKPTATVMPASSEDEDMLAAEAGQQAWESISDAKKVQARLREAAFWVANTGIGYLKTEWDGTILDKDADFGNGALGDFKISAPTPFHIFVPDLLEQDIELQKYVIQVYTMTLEEVKAQFGSIFPPDKEPSVVSTHEIMETQYLNLKGSDNEAKPDSCLVIEAWVKPGASPLFPKGGMVRVVDDVVVYKSMDGIPYEHGEFPFSKIENIPSGSFYPTSPIEDLIPIQKEINRNRSQKIEARNMTSKPGYFYQQGSLDATKWSSKPGQLIPVKPGFNMPQPIQLADLPQYTKEEHAELLSDFEDISGQHQVSKGTAPSGVTAATAISFLQEQDESLMATVYQSIEEAMQKTASQVLQLAVQYFDEPRLIKAIGTDQNFSAKFLGRSDIKNGTDIRVESGSSLPVSKSARNAMFMDMMNRGLIPADKGLELMNLPNMRSYYAEVNKDKMQAIRENIRLYSTDPQEIIEAQQFAAQQKQEYLASVGMDENEARQDPVIAQLLDQLDRPILPVNDWDNHEAHIYHHENYMKGQAFEALPDEVQSEYIKHVQEHKSTMQSMQLNQLMQGGTAAGVDIEQMIQQAAQGEIPGEQPAGNNTEGANQFTGIEEPPVDSTTGQ